MTSPVQSLVAPMYLPASVGVLYTSPVGTWTQIVKVTCCNTDTAVRTMTLYLVAPAGSPGATNTTTSAQALLAGATFNSPNEYGLVLPPGGTLQGLASSASTINIQVAGVQLS